MRVPRDGKPRCVFVGTLPPPVTGMTLATQGIVDALKDRMELEYIHIAHSKYYKGFIWRIIKAFLVGKAGLQLAIGPRVTGTSLYQVANAGYGLFYNLIIGLVAKFKGYRLLTHHEVYSYISHRDWKMAMLDKIMGNDGVHIMLCDTMVSDFMKQYASSCAFVVISNSFSIMDYGTGEHEAVIRDHEIVLGHMSNLSIEKGLDVVAHLYRNLSESINVRLVLAGPYRSTQEQRIVHQLRKEYPAMVEYRGPVYGEEKNRFFSDIDVFIFPTRYKNEAEPLVVLEALSFGVPVIASRRGCIPDILHDAGVVVPSESDFITEAYDQIVKWFSNPTSLLLERRKSKERWDAMHSQYLHSIEILLRQLENRESL